MDGINDAIAQVLTHEGIMSVNDLKNIQAYEFAKLTGVTPDSAEKILNMAAAGMSAGTIKGSVEEDEEIITASAVPAQSGFIQKERMMDGDDGLNKFSEAEKRLREELAAFKLNK